MVSMREVNKWRIEELTSGHVLILYRLLGDEDNIQLNLRRREVVRYIYQKLKKAGIEDEKIAAMLQEDVRRLRKMGNSTRFSKGLLNAVRIFRNPLVLLLKSDDYSFSYSISRSNVERIIIEKMVKAGWTTRQIAAATGQGYRRIQRIAKKLRETEDD